MDKIPPFHKPIELKPLVNTNFQSAKPLLMNKLSPRDYFSKVSNFSISKQETSNFCVNNDSKLKIKLKTLLKEDSPDFPVKTTGSFHGRKAHQLIH